MASELLKAKGDTEPLGHNWPQHFLARNSDLRSRYVPPLDKERAVAADPERIRRYFELFKQEKDEKNIYDDDVYNMDEKGVMMGVIAKVRVVVSRGTKHPYITQLGGREWVSLIECICSNGQVLSPWVIFKAKKQLKAWFKDFPNSHICISDRGWTNNELCLEWLKECFKLETRSRQRGEYRMLLFDGHACHITSEAIAFCEEKKIVLLCLPSHSTHLLQPLDIGVFAPFSTAYKKGVIELGQWGSQYSIDKLDFLKVCQQARKASITKENVQSS